MCDCNKNKKKNKNINKNINNLNNVNNLNNLNNVNNNMNNMSEGVSKDVRSIQINANDNIHIKNIVSSTEIDFIDITILKNLSTNNKFNEEGYIVLNNFCLEDIIKYPIKLTNQIFENKLKKLVNILLEKTEYNYNVLLNLFYTINLESFDKIVINFKKYIKCIKMNCHKNKIQLFDLMKLICDNDTEDKCNEYINNIIKILKNPNSYLNSKYKIEIDSQTYSKFFLYINALITRKYTNNVKITIGNKIYEGTFYTILIPDYVNNFTQIKKFINLLFSTKEIFKQLNDKATIYNTSVPASLNGEIIVYDSYNNFRNNDYYNYLTNNNISTGSYSYIPTQNSDYFNQLLPKKIYPVN